MSEPQIVLECESTLDNLGSRSSLATPTRDTSLPSFSVVHLCTWFALFSNFLFASHSLWDIPHKFQLEGRKFTQNTFLKQSLYSSEKPYNKQQNILGPHLQHAYLEVFNSKHSSRC